MSPTSEARQRLASWWRWMVQPWRSLGLIAALIGSFAVPAFMAASAGAFRTSAADSITRQVLDDRPTALDVAVVALGRLDGDSVAALDARMRVEFDRAGRLAEPRRTVLFGGGTDLGLQRPATDDGAPPETIIGSGGRFLADDGAVAALRVVDGDPAVEGVWLSERRADRLDLDVGTMVAVNGSDPVPIAGVYDNLWEGEQHPYWDDLPANVVPVYSTVFGGPAFELIVVPESLAYEFAVDGVVRWDADVVDRPETYDELVAYRTGLRRFERSFTESDEMAAAIAGFSGAGGSVPDVVTETSDVLFEIERIVDELDQPIATAALGGILLGLVVTAAGAAFAVRKREVEIRLLRADGDASWRFAVRALLQYLPPAVAGGAIGAVAGWALVVVPSESAAQAEAIDLEPIAWTVAIGLLVAAVVTAFAAGRVLSVRGAGLGALRLSWLLPVAGLAVAAWIQVGSSGDPGEVDPLVVAFPLIGLVAGVGLVVLGIRWATQRVHRSGGSLPPGLFLAWRRITAAESGAVLLAAAMGVALGLIVFSTSLAGSLDTATNAKATTVVGGPTRAQLAMPFDGDLPESTTLVRAQSARLTIGDGIVEVLAIDPSSYADGVSWDPSFGSSAAEVVEALDVAVDADVAAVVVAGRNVPPDGGFGATNVVSYEVVGTVDAVPLASEVYATLVVSADQIDDAARRDHEARRPPGVEPEEWTSEFRSPLRRTRQLVVSQIDEPTLSSFLAVNGVDVREVVTLSEQKDLVGTRAARWTFRYLGVLAVIAALAAVGTLLFYLSEQRANRQLSTVMAERMGLRRGSAALAAVAEVLGLVVVAFVAGTSIGLLLAGRVFDRFEPAPRVPPSVGLVLSWTTLAALGLAATVFVVGAALLNRWIAGRRSYGEVLRGG